MAGSQSKDRLVQLLDREVFRPILDASPDDYSANERGTLEHVKNATERTWDSYHNQYSSAQEVYDQFRSDLRSAPAKRVSRESRMLGLPSFEDVEDDFERLAEEEGIR